MPIQLEKFNDFEEKKTGLTPLVGTSHPSLVGTLFMVLKLLTLTLLCGTKAQSTNSLA
jgi:hypothetical protein